MLNEHGVAAKFECQMYRNDGRVIWVSESAQAVWDAVGNLLGYEGRLEDLTGRKKAAAAATALAEVARPVSHSLDINVLAQQLADSIGALVGAPRSVVYSLDRASGDLVALAVYGEAQSALGSGTVLVKGFGPCRPVTTTDVLTDPRVWLTPEMRRRVEQAGYRAALAVPLLVKGEVVGAIAILEQKGRSFDDEEIRLAQAFADQAALALQNRGSSTS